MIKKNGNYNEHANKLKYSIKKTNLSLLVLVSVKDFKMIKQFYPKDRIYNIEISFSHKLLELQNTQKLFNKIYILGEGIFALRCNLRLFNTLKKKLLGFFDEFVERVNESYLIIGDSKYDLNIDLSYAIGKYKLFEDAKQGLIELRKRRQNVYYANDACYMSKSYESKKRAFFSNKVSFNSYSLIPYSIPLINNLNQELEYYECFFDIKDSKNNIISPFNYLEIIQNEDEKKYASMLLLEYSFKMIEGSYRTLNINLWLSDIEDEDIRDYVYLLLQENKQYSHKIVFTILGENKIKDFSLIKHFIQKAKELGIRFALNNFIHSSLSFERLLLFNPDIIRIDESLMKSLSMNHYTKQFLKTANEFARAQNIEMIAPYMKDKKNFSILKELKIPYSQGKRNLRH